MKQCSKCGNLLPATTEFFFERTDGGRRFRSWCKKCTLSACHVWHSNNKVRKSATWKIYKAKHREHIAERNKIWQATHRKNRVVASTKWRSKNRERANAYARKYAKEKRQNNPAFGIKMRLYSRMNHAVKSQNIRRSNRVGELIGCTIPELMEHIQKQFKPGMAWNNRHLWHIDHMRPCASFDLTDPEQQRQCFHYTNLQPLWAKDNYSKHDYYFPIATNAVNQAVKEQK